MSFEKNYAHLIAGIPLNERTPERLVAVARLAQQTTDEGLEIPAAAAPKPDAPKPDRRALAHAKLKELRANPPSPGASDAVRCKHADECADAAAIAFDMEGYTDHNGHFIRRNPGPEAA